MVDQSEHPETFRAALSEFMEKVGDKAIRRAREKGRPMDPWNHYPPVFISLRLNQEIKEWQKSKKFTDAELDELYDIAALACSRFWAVRKRNGYEKRQGAKTNE